MAGLRTHHTWWSVVALLVAATLTGCVSYRNYTDLEGPRFGAPVPAGVRPPADGVLHVASFNIEWGEYIERAVEVVLDTPELNEADVLLLQEVDRAGAQRMAGALGVGWVYYPASERNGRDFGNAVLSPWPIEDDGKLILPHTARFGDSQRTATRARVRVEGMSVVVYSAHLAVPLNQSLGDRRDQFRTILMDAPEDGPVVIGGDLNSEIVPEMALEEGYDWPTREGPRTTEFMRADHILFRGFRAVEEGPRAGTVRDTCGASDHLPVWARVGIPPGSD